MTVIPDDGDFAGTSAESLPSVDYDFSCKNENPPSDADVAVDIYKLDDTDAFEFSGDWVRLPVVEAETWQNKDGASDLISTSRIEIPMVWGGTEIYSFIGAQSDDASVFDLARVSYRDRETGEWSICQFGYVASIGPAAGNGVLKFYIYDGADFTRQMPVTKTYDNPTASQVASFAAFDLEYGLDANSPLIVNDVAVTTPVSEVDIVGTLEQFDRSGWEDENTVIVPIKEAVGEEDANQAEVTTEWLDDALHAGGHKHFRENRHNLVDVLNWLTDRIGGIWYLKPEANGVTLVINNGGSDNSELARNSYIQRQVNPSQYEYIVGFNHTETTVINNTAIEDAKPINTLTLAGEDADSFFGIDRDQNLIEGPLGAPKGQSNKYPLVEVEYPPLIERADGALLGPKRIESSATTTAEAEIEAIERFKEEHEDNTEGNIEIYGTPQIRPYDLFTAKPVCNEVYDIDTVPIQYEVNTVHHHVKSDEPYTTELGVSIRINEEILKENTFSRLVDVGGEQ